MIDNGEIDLGNGSSAGSLFLNAPAASVAGTGDIVLGASAANQFGQQLSGQALTLGSGIILRGQSGSVGLASAAFVNLGTIQSDVVGGTVVIDPAGTFTNDGTVAALNSGATVLDPGTLTNLSSGTLTGGTWEAVAGGTLDGFASGITTNAATLVVNGSNSGFYSGTTDALAALTNNATGGNFTLENGWNFISANPFSNAGTVVIGSGSTLTAPYTQTGGTTSLQGGNLANFGPSQGHALSFNGTSDFVEVPSSPTLDSQALTSQATIEAWVYLDQLPSAAGHIMEIVSKSEFGNDLDLQIETDNRIHFYAGDEFPDSVVSNTVLQAGQWYHIAATFQAGQPGQLQIFVNGELDASQSGDFARTMNPNPLTIGWNYVFPGRYFNGLITDVSVWNVVETPAQIQTDLNVPLQGTEPGLVASWNFAEGTGNIAHDATANHNDGSLGEGVPSQEPTWTAMPPAALSLLGGILLGVGTVDGNLVNSGGTVSPGLGETITVNGGYTQESGGTLQIPVGGSSSSGAFGTLVVTGFAAVAGTLTVTTVNGYTPLFTDSYTVLDFASENGDFATYNLPSLGGEPLLTAAYVPAGTPTALVLSGTLSPTVTTLASSPNPSTFGQAVTLTATLTAISGNTPTGIVEFEDVTMGQNLGTANLQLTGGLDQASIVVSGLTAGSHTLEAVYLSSQPSTFADSSSPGAVQVVNRASAVISVTAGGGTYNGSAHVATATVTGVSGTAASSLEGVSPTLTYYAGAAALPGAPANAGTYTVVATFAGSLDYAASSASASFTIAPALLTVTASNASKLYGQVNPLFTDTITGFVNGDTAVVISGSASLTTAATTTSPVGTYTLVAALGTLHAANYTFAFVNGTLTVKPDATTTSVAASSLGARVTLTATVAANAPGSGTPTGSVDFKDITTGTDLGSVNLSGGSATLIVTVPAERQTVSVTYGGSANFLTSTSGVTGRTSDSIYVVNASASAALSLSDNADIQITGTIVVDSNSVTAASAAGHAQVTAANISVVGGAHASGQASFSPHPVTGAPFVANPLGGLSVPTVAGPSQGWVILSGHAAETLNPGLYSGISLTGDAHLTLNPGVYLITGGGFTVEDNASVSGSGVLIVNSAGGTIQLSDQAVVYLTGPATGTYSGIVFFQPAANSRSIELSDNAVLQLNGGIIYAPAAELTLADQARLLQATPVVNELHLSDNGSLEDTEPAERQTPSRCVWHDLLFAYGVPSVNVAALDMLLAEGSWWTRGENGAEALDLFPLLFSHPSSCT